VNDLQTRSKRIDIHSDEDALKAQNRIRPAESAQELHTPSDARK
jgi:hypothetical protein